MADCSKNFFGNNDSYHEEITLSNTKVSELIKSRNALREDIRKYLKAFAGCAYQNPVSICPHHHMMIPRIIRG